MPSQTPRPQINTSDPRPARVYDYLLGGKGNYPVDQDLAEVVSEALGGDAGRRVALVNRTGAPSPALRPPVGAEQA